MSIIFTVESIHIKYQHLSGQKNSTHFPSRLFRPDITHTFASLTLSNTYYVTAKILVTQKSTGISLLEDRSLRVFYHALQTRRHGTDVSTSDAININIRESTFSMSISALYLHQPLKQLIHTLTTGSYGRLCEMSLCGPFCS